MAASSAGDRGLRYEVPYITLFIVTTCLFYLKDKMFYTSQDCNQNNQPSAEPSGDAIEAHRRKFPKVVINVGGVRHEVMWRLFLKRPLTRLGMLAKVGRK